MKSVCPQLTECSTCTSGTIGGGGSLRLLLAGTTLLNGGGSGDSAAFGWYAPDHQGENIHTGGAYGLSYMANTLSQALNATVQWGGSAVANGFDAVVIFGGQFRSEAYLVNDADGFYQVDQCDFTQSPAAYGSCDFPAFIESFQPARRGGTKLISVVIAGGAHFPGEYLSGVDAALTLMYPGQYLADALAQVLTGAVSPGGGN